MSGGNPYRASTQDVAALARSVEAQGRQLGNLRASDIPIEQVDGLENEDGSPCTDLQAAIEALARNLP